MVAAISSTQSSPSQARKRSLSGQVLLRVSGIGVAYGGNAVLSNVNVELRQGECVLLTGENGSGKTSLINILTGNLEPSAGEISYSIGGRERTFRFPRGWYQELNPWSHFRPEFVARAGVGRSWQDVRLFGSLSLQDNLAIAAKDGWAESPLSAFALRRVSSEDSNALQQLGLGDRQDSSADMISLGQSKRVAIARAIAAGARVLFLDEPLAGLDRQGIADILAYLRNLVEQHHVTLVIVEHIFNQHHLLPLVTTRWVLEDGVCTTHAAAELKATVVEQDNSIREEWTAALATDSGSVVVEPLPRDAVLTRILVDPDANAAAPVVLDIRDLVIRLGKRSVLGLGSDGQPEPFSMVLRKGEIAILQAPNGWGKTTLFKAIAGEVVPSSGAIKVHVADDDAQSKSNRINCVPSAGVLFPNLSLREAASVAQANLPNRFEKIANRQCATLSGGERQRLALGLATPRILNVYDEPLNGLDDWQEFVTSCRQQVQQGQSVLILVPKK